MSVRNLLRCFGRCVQPENLEGCGIILLCLGFDFIGFSFIVFLLFNFGQRHNRCFEKENE